MIVRDFFWVYYRVRKAIKSYQKGENTDEALCGKVLITYLSYRLPNSAQYDRWLGLKMIYRLFLRMRGNALPRKQKNGLPNQMIWEETEKKLRSVYVKKHVGGCPEWNIGKDKILNYLNQREKILLFFCFIWFLPLIIKISITSKNRPNRALLIFEIPEIVALISFIRKYTISTIYDFLNYEIDSNITYLLVKEKFPELQYYKLPSPGPLQNHNDILLTDVLITSSGYQEEELQILKNIKYQRKEKWYPEYAFNYIHLYKGVIEEAPSKIIGYYSHGSWIREQSDHARFHMDLLYEEEATLKILSKWLKTKALPDEKLIIFPHPHEKRSEVIQKTQAYYERFFGAFRENNVELFMGNSTQHFNKVDIGVTCLSTILFERLFCGYKVLLSIHKITEFPHNKSPLNGLIFNSLESFMEKKRAISGITRASFFQQYKLEPYHYRSFKIKEK